MVVLSKTAAGFFGLCMLLTNAGYSNGASTAGRTNCEAYYFYDHGTEKCEHCRDICDYANHTKTVEQCWDMCKHYAQTIGPPKAPQPLADDDNTSNNNNDNNINTTTSEFPPTAWISLVVLGLVCVVVTTAFLAKRKTIVRRIRRHQRPTIPQQTAVVLQPLNPPRQASTPAHDDSLGRKSGGTVGIQEEGEPCAEGAGNHCYHILSKPGVAESQPLVPSPSGSTPRPIPVTSEGEGGVHEMALPGGGASAHFSTLGSLLFPPTACSSSRSDLDSTEPKTFQPSLDQIDCLIDGASGGMPTTQL